MSDAELRKISIEEFSRLQSYMLAVKEKESETYRLMKIRYFELKEILSGFGVDLTELDIVKE